MEKREATPELIAKAVKERDALEELYIMYYDRIFSYVMRRLFHVEDAEDITATTFLKMQQNLPSYKHRGVPFSAWLFQIASHELADRLRKRKQRYHFYKNSPATRQPDECIVTSQCNQETEMQQLENFIQLQQMILLLPISQQEVISLRYFEELSFKEIAGITAKSINTVKWQHYSALRKLEKMMKRGDFR